MKFVITPPVDDGHDNHDWWCFTENVATLYSWMTARDHSQRPAPCDFESYLGKPWRWSHEWDEMQAERRADGVRAAADRLS